MMMAVSCGCKKKSAIILGLALFTINMSKELLPPGGLSAECVQVSVIKISDSGASRELAQRPLGPVA